MSHVTGRGKKRKSQLTFNRPNGENNPSCQVRWQRALFALLIYLIYRAGGYSLFACLLIQWLRRKINVLTDGPSARPLNKIAFHGERNPKLDCCCAHRGDGILVTWFPQAKCEIFGRAGGRSRCAESAPFWIIASEILDHAAEPPKE